MAEYIPADSGLSNAEAFAVRLTERDDMVVVTITGELDMLTVPRAAPVLNEGVARGKPMVIDMSGLSFFSSAGLSLLVQLNEQRQDPPLDVRLVADQRVVVLPLELTGLRDLFPIHATLDEALAATR